MEDIDTPVTLIDVGRLDANLAGMAALCAAHGVRLRPHVKAHKCLEIARLQVEHGAIGLTTAKLSEAEVFVEAGFDDLFVCYPIVGPLKLRRLRALAERARVATVVDSEESVDRLASAFQGAGEPLELFIKLDVGMHRLGVDPAEAGAVADQIARRRSLRLAGVCIHEGGVYAIPARDRRRAEARDQVTRMVRTAEALRSRGHDVPAVSSGATPAVAEVVDVPGLTEVRPGNYAFYDETQVALGVVDEDSCALSVLTTVVAAYDDDRAVVDAGAKVLSLDRGAHAVALVPGYGRVRGRPGLELASLSEEHGWLRVGDGGAVRVGERLQVVPNHACVVVNNVDRLVTTRDGRPDGDWSVAARGCVT